MKWYCLQLQIYNEKSETQGAEHGLSCRVVFDIWCNYLNKNFHIYFDNFYTSYKLVNDLKNNSTFSLGTVWADRGKFSTECKESKLKKEKSSFFKDGKIVAIHWNNNCDVYAMSTMHTSEIKSVERRNSDLV